MVPVYETTAGMQAGLHLFKFAR